MDFTSLGQAVSQGVSQWFTKGSGQGAINGELGGEFGLVASDGAAAGGFGESASIFSALMAELIPTAITPQPVLGLEAIAKTGLSADIADDALVIDGDASVATEGSTGVGCENLQPTLPSSTRFDVVETGRLKLISDDKVSLPGHTLLHGLPLPHPQLQVGRHPLAHMAKHLAAQAREAAAITPAMPAIGDDITLQVAAQLEPQPLDVGVVAGRTESTAIKTTPEASTVLEASLALQQALAATVSVSANAAPLASESSATGVTSSASVGAIDIESDSAVSIQAMTAAVDTACDTELTTDTQAMDRRSTTAADTAFGIELTTDTQAMASLSTDAHLEASTKTKASPPGALAAQPVIQHDLSLSTVPSEFPPESVLNVTAAAKIGAVATLPTALVDEAITIESAVAAPLVTTPDKSATKPAPKQLMEAIHSLSSERPHPLFHAAVTAAHRAEHPTDNIQKLPDTEIATTSDVSVELAPTPETVVAIDPQSATATTASAIASASASVGLPVAHSAHRASQAVGVAHQVADATVAAAQQGQSQISLILNPEALGTVRVHLVQRGQAIGTDQANLHARLVVTTPEARDMLIEQMDALRHTLADHNIRMENVQIVVAHSANASGHQHESSQQQSLSDQQQAQHQRDGQNADQRNPQQEARQQQAFEHALQHHRQGHVRQQAALDWRASVENSSAVQAQNPLNKGGEAPLRSGTTVIETAHAGQVSLRV